MAYWSLAILISSLVYLAARHGRSVIGILPQWWSPPERREMGRGSEGKPVRSTTGQRSQEEIKAPKMVQDVDEELEGETTPKASATEDDVAIPAFTLNGDSSPQQAKQRVLPQSAATSLSHDIPKRVEPSSRTSTPSSAPGGKGLMPPPARPASMLPPSSTSSLRIPSNGPLPNRGIPANSQQRVSSLSPNGAVATPNARGKVLLAPGHSPMDWAALTRKGNLSGVGTFQRVTPSQLKSMTGRKGKPAWSSWQGKVYNITPYIPFHPGGEAEIMKAAGRDGTKLFMEVHPWVNWENMLGTCLVGVMVPESYGGNTASATESLEDID
ncbi:hypothetical protein BDY17DRAFT_116596 [Neohortaea acidophila]|uniref:Cytochrome b5 heme-binding domain-containing protein n=1 Tax=Neohortaea acidophila TaxID=245834 RepID=A0A6A6PUQ0_9PEZI|nr:uncharacterized protein BDY17DRAFT_116596 [Neohortaea acidophila]KAF2483838.1 hypothetical protein BDY17DRAFT_116596 [Neohortaea acidophila]